MNDTHHVFVLLVERTLIKEPQLELFVICNKQTLVRGRNFYRAIAANLDEQQYRDSQIVHWYNQRGEHSGNCGNELLRDFDCGQLPCADFKANAT